MELIDIVNEAIPLNSKEDVYKRLALLEDIKKCLSKIQKERIRKEAFNIAQRNIKIRQCAFNRRFDEFRRNWLREKLEEYLSQQLETV